MKTRTYKKMLSLLLALVMIVCCVPFSASGAMDAQMGDATDSPEIVALEEAVKLFNSTITTAAAEGTLYKNLSEAYEIYHDARVYCDLALLGKNDGSLAVQKTEALSAATSSLTPVTEPTYMTAPKDESYTVEAVELYGDEIENVLYADGLGSHCFWTGWSSGQRYKDSVDMIRIGLQYGAAVLLYDGVNTPALPITAFYNSYYQAPSFGGKSRLRLIAVNTPGFELRSVWHGGNSTTPGFQNASSQQASWLQGQTDPACTEPSNNKDNYYLSNSLYFSGTLGDTEYVRKNEQQNIYWEVNKDGGGANFDPTTAPIYILNYAAYKNLVTRATQMLSENPLNTLSSAYARQVLAAVDKVSAVDFNQDYGRDVVMNDQSPDWSSLETLVNNVASAVETAKNAMDNIPQTPVKADSMFDLSGAVGAQKEVYTKGNEDGMYTADSWTKFKDAYDDAYDAVSRVETDGYTITQDAIDGYISALREGVTGLTYTAKVADTSKFDAARLFVSTLTSTYYTEESYQNLASVLAAETNVVYPNGLTELPLDDLHQNIVDESAAKVWQAIAGLRLNTTTLQELIVEADAVDANKYLVGDLQKVVGEAEQFVIDAANNPFPADPYNYEGVEAAEYGKYRDIVERLRHELGNLSLAFTAIEDGTQFNIERSITEPQADSQGLNVFLNNQITSATIFKTQHGYKSYQIPYELSFFNTGGNGAQLHCVGMGYWGKNSHDYTDGGGGMTHMDKLRIRYKDGGTAVLKNTDGTPTTMDIHAALMKTPQSYVANMNYVDVVSGSTQRAPVTVMGDVFIDVYDLTTGGDVDSGGTKIIGSKTFETDTLYILSVRRNTHPFAEATFDPYEFQADNCKQTITVIDIQLLMDKVNEANELLTQSSNNQFGCYTEATWSNFVSALEAAKAALDYEDMTTEAIVTECNNRYDNLSTAINLLVKDTDKTHHNFSFEGEGLSAPTCTQTGKGQCTICGFETTVPETGHSYVYTPEGDGANHRITCSKCDEVNNLDACKDEAGDNMCDICFGNIYTQANWVEFNEVRDEINVQLSEGCTLESLKEAKAKLEALDFFAYTDKEEKALSDEHQGQIDEQKTVLDEVNEALVPADSSAYDALKKSSETLNADAYNVELVQQTVADAKTEETVEIAGTEYTGYTYDSAATDITTSMTRNRYTYNVYVTDMNYDPWYLKQDGETYSKGTYDFDNGTFTAPEDAGEFYYGDVITAKNPVEAETPVKWTMSVIAKSTDTESTPKYLDINSEVQITVRGETRLETSAGDTEGTHKLVFRDGRNNAIVFIDYVTGQVRMADYVGYFDNVPFYSVGNFRNAETSANVATNGRITVNKDTTLIVNYQPIGQPGYNIKFTDLEGQPSTTSHQYNEKVTLTAEGAKAFVDEDTDKVLFYGDTYTFFACQDLNIKAVSELDEEGNYATIYTPVQNNGKAYFIGSFAVREGCTVKGYGFVADLLGTKSNLSLADVNAENYCYNLSASTCTVGNQFIVSTTAPATPQNIKLVAYVIYENENGIESYGYSDVIDVRVTG